MTTKLTRMGVLSVAKVYGIISAIFGLLIGAMFTLMSLFGGAMVALAGEGGGGFAALLFGGMAIIIMPIFYGIMGFVGGAISAWIYNLAAGWIGGVELELDIDRPGDALG